MGEVKVDGFTEALAVAGAKIFVERTLAPMVGNGTIQSGAVKLLGAKLVGSVAKSIDKRIGKIVETAMVIDGAEDIATSLMANFNMPIGARSEPAFM